MKQRKFANIDPIRQHNSLKQFKRWRQERSRKLREKDYSYQVPCAKPDVDYLHRNVTARKPSVTWIGHSTFLIQLGGLNIVTDPVWAGQMAFQKRLAPPGIPIESLPPIDIVLISHSHYDHLHMSSLRRLPGRKRLLVPAGLRSKLLTKGFTEVMELEWWESTTIHGLKFSFVPSQHWTRRTLLDTNRSHWGGWVIEPYALEAAAAERSATAVRQTTDVYAEESRGSVKRPVVSSAPTIYFAGDSGYFGGFSEIGRRFAIDVALMPIGAYEPEWFMGPQHVTPEEALQAFADTGAEWFVPMHYGSFKLADDTPREALDRLEAERVKREIGTERIVVLPHGETWRLSGK
ncbi:MBL fold metallo-hydrolase [Paenibacillus sp. NPDC058071]|uniref:MBL fold metallo-hydrolase n=1 Tax=Paenibacillus sp. NPDC058071 TaxID=3346326 RepID=UPI0036DA041F